jgi:hypothetical protein
MLVVRLFAVLIWDSLFPDRRDVLVLAPLPIRTRTIFLAKVAAIASALGLAVGSLHLVAGLAWPVRLGMTALAFTVPALTADPAIPPVGLDQLKAVLDADLGDALHGQSALTPGGGGGVVMGLSVHGERRVFAYGAAAPDSISRLDRSRRRSPPPCWRTWWRTARCDSMNRCAICCRWRASACRSPAIRTSRCATWRRIMPGCR